MKRLSYTFLIVILFVGITGCGDNGTGSEPEEPPQTPDLEYAQPDVSYFEGNNPQKSSTVVASTDNFMQAKTIVLWNTVLFSFGQTYGMFFHELDRDEFTFNDGVWEWSYTYNYGGLSADYRTTAEELSDAIRWATYWSYDDGTENSFENYKIFEGTVANDESSGDWTFNVMNPELDDEVPFITSNWEVLSDDERTVSLEMYGESIDDETSSQTATIDFEQNSSDYTMELNFADGDNYLVTWNIDTNTGSISVNGDDPQCWDEEFQDIPCE